MKRLALLLLLPLTAIAALPPPAKEWNPLALPSPAADSIVSVAPLLDKPAGKDGPIVARGGHFYTGRVEGKRIRFFGVNLCFAACFPTHEQADKLAPRLAALGINAVRFHHMDSQPFPAGIFLDKKLEALDPVALDRLDYLIAQLKKNGIYSNLNLHVSRSYPKPKGAPGADKLPDFDKLIDLFDPEMIDMQKTYAHDLLTHVNPYTKNAYTSEPAVCMVEINNENTLFLWGGDQKLAAIPEPYATRLQQLWNDWLTRKYGSREKLAEAWNQGAQPLGENILKDAALATAGEKNSLWVMEQHEGAAMSASYSADKKSATLTITKVTNTSWHLQFKQPKLALKKGQFYTLRFTAGADAERPMEVGIAQDGPPYKNLGLANYVDLSTTSKEFSLHFVAGDDSANARLSFSVGKQTGSITLSNVTLAPGGQQGLGEDEIPDSATVKRHDPKRPFTQPRLRDWYDFLQSVDQNYFTAMYRYLRQDLRLQTPITGTIGLGALGTLSQSKMDFVDAHAYRDHPTFPGRPWDGMNWRITNKPMVDVPGATLPELAAIRVAGKPFTVTEYNHGAPNDYQAETVPLIATFAALQDWDAVYLFAWSHNANFDSDHMDNFFDIKNNHAKLYAVPAAARMFLSGNVKPLPAADPVVIDREQSLLLAPQYSHRLWPQLMETHRLSADVVLKRQFSVAFAPEPKLPAPAADNRLTWTAAGPGTGQFALNDSAAAVFVGFPKAGQSITLGPVTLSKVESPFLSAMLLPVDASAKSPRYLLTLLTRTQNTNMQWNEARTSVSDKWGKAPVEGETLHATLTIPAGYSLFSLDAAGAALESMGKASAIDLSASKSIWYELRPTTAAKPR